MSSTPHAKVPALAPLEPDPPATVTPARRPAAPGAQRRPGQHGRWLLAVTVLIALMVGAPVLSVATHLLSPGTAETWRHLLDTVLPDYVLTTLQLCLGVALGSASVGVGAAWLVTRYHFPGRRHLEWALVLPLAMPAYVLAYTYTDLLQFVGPVQTALRHTFGWTRADYWFPEVRSTGGAVLMFTLALYPYVYLMARTTFLERAAGMLEVGRSLGLGPWASFWRVSLPMARPAIAGGVALVLMETLADYGTVAYFSVQTFTTGIYRAWFSLGDRPAAAQLAVALLAFVAVILTLERASRGRARFHDTTLRRLTPLSRPLRGWRAAVLIGACLVPLTGGFLLPGGLLLHMALTEGDAQWGWRFVELARNSFLVAGLTALACVALAVLIAYAARQHRGWLLRIAQRIVGLGYAVPGSVIAVGVLIPVARLDNLLAELIQSSFGWNPGLLLTGSITALVYACVARFLTAAVQAVDSGLLKITPSMDDAARSMGLTPPQVLRRVHLPLLRGSLLTAALLVFIDVMKELPATLVMRPFNFDTLATQVYTLASDERLAEASTAALAIVAVGLIPIVLLSRQIAGSRIGHGSR
ncbi:iron(III) transport system permease protein [Sphaerotilus hippei]|uniref:Iron(III) transport system permease protein n=1 Tax=Sphaerotilus hippei TaxID=744406 RepID=A0A318H516_9BURK|nr:iron ABC transporter permease [Sphaerotilus hippei]PXW98831.1 iron(III) transport system permease protein [Sphaerotilus hippei]